MSDRSYSAVASTADSLSVKYFKRFVANSLVPVHYTRTREIPRLLDCSGILDRKNEPLRILDIGSPQILSLSLARFSKIWEVVYINAFREEVDDVTGKAIVLGLGNLTARLKDVTRPEYLSDLGTFDHIFSCSVFEHIHPEEGGDAAASGHLGRMMKPGAIASLSVPYFKVGFHEYKTGDVYMVRGKAGEKTFFQRFYDEESLLRQIIAPSGLSIVRKSYIGERFYHGDDIHRRLANRIGSGPLSFALGRCFRPMSRLFMTSSDDARALKKPYLAVFSMRKD